jgi:hypothetical protein
MRLGAIGDLVAHAGGEDVRCAVSELGVQFPGEAEEDVPFVAPVIGAVAGGVFDHAHTDVAKLARAPRGGAVFACVRGGGDGGPVGDAEGDVGEVHGGGVRRCRNGDRRASASGVSLTQRSPLERRRASPATPIRPVLSRASVAGSGVTETCAVISLSPSAAGISG